MAADTISFARGAPSLDIIDVEGLKEAAARAFANDPGGATAYGTAIGYAPLRAWIAEQHGVEPAEVVVTNGSMQADAFLFDELVEPSDTVVVERPTYDRTLLALRQRLADIRMVELEHDGIDVDGVATLIDGGVAPKLAHIIPNFQNPAGYTLSGPKREALLGLAREHGFMIFEDDPYVSIRFAGDPLPTMLSLDRDETVVYASSFSKTVCPGIRVGYLVGPAELIARIVKRATSTYISPNMVSQAIVHEFCQSGALQRSIETVRTNLKARVDALVGGARARPSRRALRRAGGRLLHVGRAARGHRRRQALRRRRGARRDLREGLRLPPGGRAQHVATRVLGRHARADRRGHRPPGRGLQQPERHSGRGIGEGVEEVGDDVVGPLVDLALAVAARDVAVAA